MQWVVFLTAVALAQGVYEPDIAAAFEKARKQKKPLWVMVSATWCMPCKIAEETILPDKRFQETLVKDFVPLHVFAASDEKSTPGGDSLARRYQVRAFPTFLYLEPTGEVFFRTEGLPIGSSRVDDMLRNLESAKKARKDLPALRKRYQKGERSLEFLRAYLNLVLEVGLRSELSPLLQEYIKVAGSPRRAWLAEPGQVERLGRLVELDPTQAEYALQIIDSLRPHLSAQELNPPYRRIVSIHFEHTMSKEVRGLEAGAALEKARQYIRRYKAVFPPVEPLVLEQLWRVWLTHPDSVRRRLAADLAVETMYLSWPMEIPDAQQREEIAERLNSTAWTFYKAVEAPDKLWVAVGWTKQALAYKPEAWHIWDTLGALYLKLRRKEEAIQALEKAIQLAKAQEVSQDEYQQTEQLLQQAQNLPD